MSPNLVLFILLGLVLFSGIVRLFVLASRASRSAALVEEDREPEGAGGAP